MRKENRTAWWPMPCGFSDVGQSIVLHGFAAEDGPPAVGTASVEALYPGLAAVQGSAAAQGVDPGQMLFQRSWQRGGQRSSTRNSWPAR